MKETWGLRLLICLNEQCFKLVMFSWHNNIKNASSLHVLCSHIQFNFSLVSVQRRILKKQCFVKITMILVLYWTLVTSWIGFQAAWNVLKHNLKIFDFIVQKIFFLAQWNLTTKTKEHPHHIKSVGFTVVFDSTSNGKLQHKLIIQQKAEDVWNWEKELTVDLPLWP